MKKFDCGECFEMKNLYLYGSGNRCKILLRILKDAGYHLCGILDTNSDKWGIDIEGIKVQNPDILYKKKDVYVCVTFYSSLIDDPIWKLLETKYHIEQSHILTFHNILYDIYRRKFTRMSEPHIQTRQVVLFDATWGLGLGGVETWLKDIIGYFQRYQNGNVYLLTKRNQEKVPNEVEERIIEFHFENSSQFFEEDIYKGIEFIKQHAPCTLVFSRANELLLAACICKERFPDLFKIIMVDHGLCDGMIKDILSYKEAIDYYVCVGSGIRKTLVREGIEKEKTAVMTIPVKMQEKVERSYSINNNPPIQLGYAGRLEVFQKRMDILIQLILELEYRKVDYCFNIAGKGNFEQNIRQFVKENQLDSKVTLYGQIENEKIVDFWKEQDVAINVSDHEGRPISNMEAMVYGAVPVVTDTVGIRDDVENGINGYIVPINDYHSMADKIEYLDKHREILPVFGKKAQTDMRKKMNIDDYMKFWLRIIK